jgi:hypothetical protein
MWVEDRGLVADEAIYVTTRRITTPQARTSCGNRKGRVDDRPFQSFAKPAESRLEACGPVERWGTSAPS